MAKNIVLCSDGTGNSAGKRGEGTNVWKLFRAVDVHCRNSEKRLQMSFYDDGVGSGGVKILKTLGGAFGMGLNRNIRELYSFLVHHYDPGDRIFLFGFSRGAFTVRALAGFVHTCGIIDRNRQMPFPWRWWHWLLPWRWGRKGTAWSLEERIGKAFSVYRDVHRSGASGSARGTELTSERSRAFRDEQSLEIPQDLRGAGCRGAHEIPIQCLGLWDTVDAVGLPVDELTQALDKILRFSFYRHGLLPCVQKGFHALAIDDQRHTFHPVLWDESRIQPHQQIEQVWFAGMHSNVGGGYPKDQMALVTLDWMMRKVGYDATDNPQGLHFRPGLAEEWCQEANVNGKLYDSRAGLSAYYRYRPRDIEGLCEKGVAALKPNGKPKRTWGNVKEGEEPKVREGEVKIHQSVLDRLQEGAARYAPGLLPESFVVVGNPKGGRPPSERRVPKPAPEPGETDEPTRRQELERRAESRRRWEGVRGQVLAATTRRSLLYHAFLYATLALVVAMLVLWISGREPDSAEARALAPDTESVEGLLDLTARITRAVFGTVADGLKWALPEATENFIDFILVEEPLWLIGLLAVAGFMFWRRGKIFAARDRSTQDARKHILEEWSNATGNDYVSESVTGRAAARPVRWQSLAVNTLGLVLVLVLLLGAVRLTFQDQDAYGAAMSVTLMVAAPVAAFGIFRILFRLTGRNPGPRPLNERPRGYDVDDVDAEWSESDLKAERRFLILDLFFPPVYGAAFAYSLFVAARYMGWTFERWYLLPIVAFVVADWIENLIHLGQLGRFEKHTEGDDATPGATGLQDGWIRVASMATVIKLWGVVLVGWVGVVVLSVLVSLRALGWV